MFEPLLPSIHRFAPCKTEGPHVLRHALPLARVAALERQPCVVGRPRLGRTAT